MAEKQDHVRARLATGGEIASEMTNDVDIPTPPSDFRPTAQMEASASPSNPSLLTRFHAAAPQYRKSLFRR